MAADARRATRPPALAAISPWLDAWRAAVADDEPARAPARRPRLLAALIVAAVAGTFCGLALARPNAAPDFLVFWHHARTLLEGRSPYLEPFVIGPGRVAPFMYPLPAAMLVAPFAWLPMPVGGGLFFAMSSGLLAYALLGRGYGGLLAFASGPFILAATMGQWSPLLTAAVLLPWLGALAFIKPNLGVAAFAYRPSPTTIAGGILLLAASLVLVPRWPLEWLRVVRANAGIYHAPVAATAGFLLPLALLRWRRPEARLLLAMACLPQLLFFYDQLLLWLIPRTWKEFAFLSGTSLIAWLAWLGELRPGVGANQFIVAAEPYVMYGIYLPALLIVLFGARQPVRASHASAHDAALPQTLGPLEIP